MYAIAFDLESAKLKEHYGEPYNLPMVRTT